MPTPFLPISVGSVILPDEKFSITICRKDSGSDWVLFRAKRWEGKQLEKSNSGLSSKPWLAKSPKLGVLLHRSKARGQLKSEPKTVSYAFWTPAGLSPSTFFSSQKYFANCKFLKPRWEQTERRKRPKNRFPGRLFLSGKACDSTNDLKYKEELSFNIKLPLIWVFEKQNRQMGVIGEVKKREKAKNSSLGERCNVRQQFAPGTESFRTQNWSQKRRARHVPEFSQEMIDLLSKMKRT